MHLVIIPLEFLYRKCILATLLENRAQYLKIFVLINGTQFCSARSSIGLIYSGPVNWSFRREMPCVNYFVIIIYSKFPRPPPIFFFFFLRSGLRKSGGI